MHKSTQIENAIDALFTVKGKAIASEAIGALLDLFDRILAHPSPEALCEIALNNCFIHEKLLKHPQTEHILLLLGTKNTSHIQITLCTEELTFLYNQLERQLVRIQLT